MIFQGGIWWTLERTLRGTSRGLQEGVYRELGGGLGHVHARSGPGLVV